MAITRRETARGASLIESANSSMTNTAVETTLFTSTVVAGSMGTNKELRFELYCTLTTPAIPPSLTIRIKFGASTLTLGGALAIAALQTGKPFLIRGLIVNKGAANAQFIYAEIKQTASTLPIVLSTAGGLEDADWTEDTASNKTFAVTAQFGSAISGSTLTFRHAIVELS